MSPRIQPAKAIEQARLFFNADVAAIAIALSLAILIRFNILPRIGW
ncbi:MAG: hypothetical protein V4555_13990 [Acidobacteriota bacterium]